MQLPSQFPSSSYEGLGNLSSAHCPIKSGQTLPVQGSPSSDEVKRMRKVILWDSVLKPPLSPQTLINSNIDRLGPADKRVPPNDSSKQSTVQMSQDTRTGVSCETAVCDSTYHTVQQISQPTWERLTR